MNKKQQKIIIILTIILLLFFSLNINTVRINANISPTVTLNGVNYVLMTDNTYQVQNVVNRQSTAPIVIPSSVNGLPVTSVGLEAFAFSQASSITFENSNIITKIEQSSFRETAATNALSFQNITRIPMYTFFESNFSEIHLNSDLITEVQDSAFFMAKATNEMRLMNVTRLGHSSFHQSNFSKIYLDSDKVVSVGRNSFLGTVANNEMTLMNLTTILEGTFNNSKFTKIYLDSDKVTSVGAHSFSNAAADNEMTLMNITTIPDAAFQLTKFPIINIDGNKITSIGKFGFNQSKATNVMDLPNLTVYSQAVFQYSNFSKIYVNGDIVTYVDEQAFYNSKADNPITLPNIDRVNLAAFQNTKFVEINLDGSKITSLPLNAFQYTEATNVMSFPNMVTIGNGAFQFSNFPEILLNENTVTSVGNSAFSDSKATNVMSLKNITAVGSNTFAGSKFSEIHLDGNKITSLGNNAFNTSIATNVMSLPNVTSIPQTTFQNTHFAEIHLDGNKVTTIALNAFNNARATNDISLTKLTTIPSRAFTNSSFNKITLDWTKLTSINSTNTFKPTSVDFSINGREVVANTNYQLTPRFIKYVIQKETSPNVFTNIGTATDYNNQTINIPLENGNYRVAMTYEYSNLKPTETFYSDNIGVGVLALETIPSQTLDNKDAEISIDLANYLSNETISNVTFSTSSAHDKVTPTIVNGVLTLKGLNVGSDVVTVRVNNNETTVVKTFNVTVNNRLPIETNPIPNQVFENKTVSKEIDLSNHFTDVDGQTLTYTVTSLNNKITPTINNSTLILDAYNIGDDIINVTVSDGLDSISKTFNVTVNNRLPVETNVIPNQVLENKTVTKTIDLSNHFNELDEQLLSYTVSSNNNNVIATVSDSILNLQGNNIGESTITITVSDGIGSITKTFTTTVNNRLPVEILPIPNQVLENKTVTKTIDLSNYFNDDDGQVLTYTVTSDNNNVLTTVNDSVLTLSGNYVGESTITVTVSDGIHSITKTFTTTVNNRLPIETTVIPNQVLENKTITKTIDLSNYFNDDDGQVLTYTVTSDNNNVFVNTNTSVLTLIGNNVGESTITVMVSDGIDFITVNFNVSVLEVNNNDEGDKTDVKAMLRLEEGEFSLATSDIISFGKVQLIPGKQTITTNFENKFTVIDARGTQQGYHVNVSATPFVEDTFDGFIGQPTQLPIGTLSLNGTENITQVGTVHNSKKPTNKIKVSTIIDSGEIMLLEANNSEGMGEFNLLFENNHLSMVIDAATAKIDKINYPNTDTPYTSTVTFNLITGP